MVKRHGSYIEISATMELMRRAPLPHIAEEFRLMPQDTLQCCRPPYRSSISNSPLVEFNHPYSSSNSGWVLPADLWL